MRMLGTTRAGRRRAVAGLALLLVTVGVVSADTLTTPRRSANGWDSLWMGSATTGTGTTLADVRTIIGADTSGTAALDGTGIGIALIDTGVTPVSGLPAAQIVNGPDLSFESQASNLRYLDTYGHGTHLAGIIVGNDTTTGTKGLAPKAKLTSIKVGAANGAADVSQMIAAIDWVVAHRNDDPANPIRVLNLAYGSGGNPAFWTDPVQFAVEQAWLAGIVVVAAVGNDGNGYGKLDNPASDPYVISVGAALTNGTIATSDDSLSTYTNLATAGKQVDILAPGESILSLRNPGSNIDNGFAAAQVGTTLFRGSGTSQATAVTSAAVALLLQAKPWLVPDQVKWLFKQSATYIPSSPAGPMGLKEINVQAAMNMSTEWQQQTFTLSNGHGLLEDARGTSHVVSNGVQLSGENSVFGPFSSATWASASAARTSWNGGVWMGYRMAGDGWTGTSWASRTWAAGTWPGTAWDGSSWTDPTWPSHFWSGGAWGGGGWVSHFWSTEDWSTSCWC